MSLRSCLMFLPIALPMAAFADVPVVMTDFAPTQNIVAQIMDGVGTPDVLLAPGDNPHDFTMRPSQARALSDTDVVIWLGPTLTPWLTDPLANLAPDAAKLTLLETEGWTSFQFRDGHDHDGDHHDEDTDPHAWTDPQIVAVWAKGIADLLIAQDPENMAIYAANLATFEGELAALGPQIDALLQEVDGAQIILPHDSFQYLEQRTGLVPAGYVTASDDADPGPAHLRELREMVVSGAVTCVLSGSALDQTWVDLLTDGTDAKTAVIDATDRNGVGYLAMMQTLATTLRDCAN